MAINKNTQSQGIDNSNLTAYPYGQVTDNDGTSDGFLLQRNTTSDIFETFGKLIRLAGIVYNNQYDNETNGFQYIQALQALAGKNDIRQPLTASTRVISTVTTPVLVLPLAIETLQINEILICQAASTYAAQAKVTGNTSGIYINVASSDAFQANDYLLLVNTNTGMVILQIALGANFNAIALANNFIKAANNATTIAGTATNAAVTPASLLYALGQYLNNATYAAAFYATDSLPGLLSAADKTAIDGFTNPVKNVGWFSGIDAGGGTVGAFAARSGDITSAQITYVESHGDYTTYLVTMNNAMNVTGGASYYVKTFLESNGTLAADLNTLVPLFSVIDATTFSWSIQQSSGGGVQNLKAHIEVYQI